MQINQSNLSAGDITIDLNMTEPLRNSLNDFILKLQIKTIFQR